nr:CAunnamed protein product [Biomphalaria glabrata]
MTMFLNVSRSPPNLHEFYLSHAYSRYQTTSRGKRLTRTAVQAKSHFFYLTNFCSKTFHVRHSVNVALTPIDKLPSERSRDFISCWVDLKAVEGLGLLVHFTHLNISPVRGHSDHLHLYSMVPYKKRVSPKQGIYGHLNDTSGSLVSDYKILNDTIRIEYFGLPTSTYPGFQLLVSAFYEPDPKSKCREKYLHCPVTDICIAGRLACDGDPNCGQRDVGDEVGCDRDDTVTDLLTKYSLTRDIIVVILLPLIVFLLCVFSLFCMAQKVIKHTLEKHLTLRVGFTKQQDGRVILHYNQTTEEGLPAYEDIMQASPDEPPSYNSAWNRTKMESRCYFSQLVHVSRVPSSSPIPESLEEYGACGGGGE